MYVSTPPHIMTSTRIPVKDPANIRDLWRIVVGGECTRAAGVKACHCSSLINQQAAHTSPCPDSCVSSHTCRKSLSSFLHFADVLLSVCGECNNNNNTNNNALSVSLRVTSVTHTGYFWENGSYLLWVCRREKQAGVLWEQINPGRRPNGWLIPPVCSDGWCQQVSHCWPLHVCSWLDAAVSRDWWVSSFKV